MAGTTGAEGRAVVGPNAVRSTRDEAANPRQVFLHVGPPKTGTTYLQSVLHGNKAALHRAGVLVPGQSQAAHFEAASDLRGRPRRGGRRKPAGAWDRFTAEVRQWPGTSVISCEWLAFCDEAQVTRAVSSFGAADVHVVVTLRDLGRLVPAVWQEQVKNGKHFTVTEFLDQLAHPETHAYGQTFWNVHDTRELVGRWRQVPHERIHLVTLPAPGAPPDELWRRFGGLLVTDPSHYDTTGVRANPGLGPADAELLRRVNAELGGRMRKAAHAPLIKQLLHGELTSQGSGGKIRLPADTLVALAERADAIVADLRSAGYPVAGTLDDLAVDTTAVASSLPEDSPVEEVASSAVRSMAALLLAMQADGVHRRKSWRRRAAKADDGAQNDGGLPTTTASPGRAGPARQRAAVLARRVVGKVRHAARS